MDNSKAAGQTHQAKQLQRTGMATATAGTSSPPTPHADDSPETSLPGEKVYVAVGREVAESRATLLWALHRFPRGAGAGAASFVLLHVYSPPKLLPFRTSLALFFHFLFSAANAKVFLFTAANGKVFSSDFRR